jgi:hypothetical protein
MRMSVRTKRYLLAAALVCVLLPSCLVGLIVRSAWTVLTERWDPAGVAAARTIIDTDIVPALDRYRTRVGAYPGRLEDLVPTDLPSLPALPVGKLVYKTNQTPPLDANGKPKWAHYFEVRLVSRSYPGFWFTFVRTSRHLIYVSTEGRWRAEKSF